MGKSPCEVSEIVIRRLQTPVRGQAVNQRTVMRSVLHFFATAQSLFPFFVFATETSEGLNTSRQSRECHRDETTELALNDVVGKVPLRSCRECHRKPNDTSSWTVKQSSELRSALVFFATAQFLAALFRQRNKSAPCCPWNHAWVRALKAKPSISRLRLATLSSK